MRFHSSFELLIATGDGLLDVIESRFKRELIVHIRHESYGTTSFRLKVVLSWGSLRNLKHHHTLHIFILIMNRLSDTHWLRRICRWSLRAIDYLWCLHPLRPILCLHVNAIFEMFGHIWHGSLCLQGRCWHSVLCVNVFLLLLILHQPLLLPMCLHAIYQSDLLRGDQTAFAVAIHLYSKIWTNMPFQTCI